MATEQPQRRSWRTLLIGIIVGLAIAVIGGLTLLAPLVLAHRSDLPFERSYGNFAVSLASRFGAGGASNPTQGDPRAIAAGRLAYTGSCAVCHGANGDGKGVFGTATYPPATSLIAASTKQKSDAQLFWIIKNGLSFTGMPAFSGQYNDQDIWSLVSFIRSLQTQAGTAAVAVPTPSVVQLAAANPTGNATQRGAAVYFAQGCAACHGVAGNAPNELGLRGGGGEATRAVRSGRRGMPAYSTAMLSDTQLQDLAAYLNTLPGGGQREGEGGGENRRPLPAPSAAP